MTILILQILGAVAAVAVGVYIGLHYFSRGPVGIEAVEVDVEVDEEGAFPRTASRQVTPFSMVSRVTGIKTRQVRRDAFRLSSQEDSKSSDRNRRSS